MGTITGEWVDISIIASTAAQIENAKEEKRLPQHPRKDLLEQDLYRAIRIMNEAGFTVIKETTEPKEKMRVQVSAIADVPKGLDKETLMDMLANLHWYGEKLIQRENITTKIIL